MKIPSQAALFTLGALTLSACGSGTEGTAEEGEDLVIDGQTIATAELLEAARKKGLSPSTPLRERRANSSSLMSSRSSPGSPEK